MALLHRVKERKTLSLSTHASFALFSLKVAWSGKSIIAHFGLYRDYGWPMVLQHTKATLPTLMGVYQRALIANEWIE